MKKHGKTKNSIQKQRTKLKTLRNPIPTRPIRPKQRLLSNSSYRTNTLSQRTSTKHICKKKLTEKGYVTLVFDGSYFGESQGQPRQQELPYVKQTDIEGAIDYLTSLPYVDPNKIWGLGICGSGSYMSVAGVREPRLKAITAIVPAISDISTSAMAGFFMLEEIVKKAKEKYEKRHRRTSTPQLHAKRIRRRSSILLHIKRHTSKMEQPSSSMEPTRTSKIQCYKYNERNEKTILSNKFRKCMEPTSINRNLRSSSKQRKRNAHNTRSLITISALFSAGQYPQIKAHIALGKEHEIIKEEIIETITQLAFYCGWLKTWSTFPVIDEIYNTQ